MEAANAAAKEFQEKVDKVMEEEKKVKGFSKLWPYNKPIAALPIALLASFICGCSHLTTAVVFSKMMPLLGLPFEYIPYMFPEEEYKGMDPKEIIKQRVTIWAGLCVAVSVTLAIFTFIGRSVYGLLGTNCTQEVRKILYTSIL